MTEFDFVFVRLVSLNFDINFNKESDNFRKGSDWYPHRMIGILDAKDLIAGIIKSGLKMRHTSGKIITANRG